jgi:DsbC/DsbD-like thiol-disulfide interchange protein
MQTARRNSLARLCAQAFGAILAILLQVSPNLAQEHAQGPHTVLTLLSDRRSLIPGGNAWVGLRFNMEPGWHIYWINPGDSGEPPKIQWHFPAGIRLGPIEWPAPQRLTAPSIVDYGYENQALLIAPLYVAAGVKNRTSVTLAANVNWLVCREICIPAKAHVSLAFPVNKAITGWRGSAASADVGMLIDARARVPKPQPNNWIISAADEKNSLVLSVETGQPESATTFFPLVPQQIKNGAAQIVTPVPGGVRLKLQKSDALLKPIERLRGVIEFSSGKAFQISAPIRSAAKGNQRKSMN